MRFDVVIFDEASQVLPGTRSTASTAATQLIVAGDQKQLPPTDFFAADRPTTATSDDEDGTSDEFESVLDLCEGRRRAAARSRCAGTTAAGTRR